MKPAKSRYFARCHTPSRRPSNATRLHHAAFCTPAGTFGQEAEAKIRPLYVRVLTARRRPGDGAASSRRKTSPDAMSRHEPSARRASHDGRLLDACVSASPHFRPSLLLQMQIIVSAAMLGARPVKHLTSEHDVSRALNAHHSGDYGMGTFSISLLCCLFVGATYYAKMVTMPAARRRRRLYSRAHMPATQFRRARPSMMRCSHPLLHRPPPKPLERWCWRLLLLRRASAMRRRFTAARLFRRFIRGY